MAINLFQPGNNNIFGNSAPWNSQSQNSQQSTTPWSQPPISNNKAKVEGSTRAPFKSVKLDHIPPDTQQNGTPQSTSIILQSEYKGMSIMMVRLEDYYLIRSKQIQQFHEKIVEGACRCGQFNPQLITQANPQTLTPPQFPTLRNAWSSTTPNNPIFNSTSNTNNLFPQTNNNLFAQPQTQAPVANIFNKPNTPIPNSNIFQNPSSGSTTNPFQSSNQNPFNNSTTNVFNSQNQQKPAVNIFGQPIQQSTQQPFQQPVQNLFPQPQQGGMNMFQQQQPASNMNLFNQQPNTGFNLFNQPPLFQQPMMQSQPMLNTSGYYPYPQYPQYMYPQMAMSMPAMQPLSIIPTTPLQIQEQVTQLQNCAEMMSTKLQQYLQNQEEEQRRLEQQEMVFREHERQRLQLRQQRERVLNQPLSLSRAAKSKSPTPISRNQKSNPCLRKSQINESMMSIQPFDDQNTTLIVESIVCFMESEKKTVLNYEFRSRQRVGDVKQYIEQQLTQINVFGAQKYQYFSNCIIKTEHNQILDDSTVLDRCPSSKIVFEYFPTIVPKLTKNGYTTNVNLSELSEPQLKNVPNFTIFTKYGSVKWTTPCDLLFLDLDKIIDMQQECINLYDSQIIHEFLKPEVGDKLNKECDITFKLPADFKIQDPAKFEKKLKEQATDQGLDMLSFDAEQRSYTFRVQHFSGYHFNSEFYASDDSTYQVPVNQVGVQTNNQETMVVEQQNNVSESDDVEDEAFLERKRKFNKQRPIHSNNNYAIQQFNQKNSKQVPLNKQNLQINIKNSELLTCFCCENSDFTDQPLKVRISAQLISALWQSSDKSYAFKLKLFNTLFGNAQVKISHFVKQLNIGMITLEDLKEVQLEKKYNRGLALSLLFESQKKSQQMDYREALLNINKLSLIQKVLVTVNFKSQIQIPQKDLIDYFNGWRLNSSQPKPLYENQWWLSLYNHFRTIPISSPEEAAFIYYLLKKSKQSQTEYGNLFNYLLKGNDAFTYLLFYIMIKQNKVISDSLKLIGRTLITKLMKFGVNYQIIQNFLAQFKGNLYTISEISKIENLVCQCPQYYENSNGNQQIEQLIYTKDFQRAAVLIFQLRKTEEYQSILVEYILPFLILQNEQFTVDKTKILIQQIVNTAKYPSSMIALAQLFLGNTPYSNDLFDKAEIHNEYQYHMKEKLKLFFNDEF